MTAVTAAHDTGLRTKASPLRHRVRGRVLLLLCGLYFLSYLDRTNISTAEPFIRGDLHLTNTELGIALAAFSLPYAFLQAAGGWIGDRLGPRRMLAGVAVVCGVATLATGFAGGLVTLIASRLLLGLGEGPAFPTATRAMSRWLPADRRGYGQGIVHAASRIGGAVAPLVVAALIAWRDWRMSFWVCGVLSVAWGALWLRYFRDEPADHPAVERGELEELDLISADGTVDVRESARPQPRWRPVLRAILPVTAIDFCYGWLLWLYLTWLPAYFSDRFDLELKKFALFTTFVLVAGVVGDTVGGVLSDAILRRTSSLRTARRVNLLVGLIGSFALLLPTLWIHSLTVDTVLLSGAFFFLELTNPALWAIPMDVAPENAGLASGFMNTGFGLAGVVSPVVVGALLDRTGSWFAPIAVSAAMLAVGAVLAARLKVRPAVPAPR